MHQIDMLAEVEIRQQQAAREAHLERQRRAREAQGAETAPFYQPALASLGRQLVAWGNQLQHASDDPCQGRDVLLAPLSE